MIFRRSEDVNKFLNYLNNQHSNIKFTFEVEENDCLPFLDVLINKSDSGLSTKVYRKPTHSNVGLSWFSFCESIYKINSIKTLLNRAYNNCSSYFNLHMEFKVLEKFFLNNNYCPNVFHKLVNAFMTSKFENKGLIYDVPKLRKYIKLPFYGKPSYELRKQLNRILHINFPAIKFNIIFTNELKIKSFFKLKDAIPESLCSNIVYQFICPHCHLRYIGCSSRAFRSRIFEHMGKSIRTGRFINKQQFSAIRNHSIEADHKITEQNFKIIAKFRNKNEAFIAEKHYIDKYKPELNTSA